MNFWEDLLADSCGLSDCASEALSGALVVSDVSVSSLFRWCCDVRSFVVGL